MTESRPGRSEEEREAARLERERRRAERSGQVAFSEEQEPPVDHGAAAVPDGPASEQPFDYDGHNDGDDGRDDGYGDDEDGYVGEAASGTKRISRLQRHQRAPRKPPPPRRSRRPAGEPRPRRRTWAVRALSLGALVLALALIWFLFELFQPFHGSGHGRVTVTIPPHSTTSQIGDQLARDGVIASSFFFDLRSRLAGDRADLRAGTYTLKLDMSYSQVLKVLTTAPPAARVSELTIIPGRTRSQIDRLLRTQGIRGSYLAATRHSKLLDPRSYGAQRSTPTLEGFLFPSTYQLREPITVGALVADQLQTFKQQFGTVNLAYARRHNLTPYDVLTIASIVEGEAGTAHDRPLVASVIYNRLSAGMPLGIDATIRYATGNYTHPLTESELHSPSPYNTRIRPGLPPTPIDNPGLASIEAAAHPAQTNYLYFVAKVCGNGASAFASTYAQFEKDAQQYQAARAARGGRSLTHC